MSQKITEKTTTNAVKSTASFLITQPEGNPSVESLRRATLESVKLAIVGDIEAVLDDLIGGDSE